MNPPQPETDTWPSLGAVSLVASYVPRRCGIATFTNDLTEALAGVAPDVDFQAVAMNDRPEGYRYGPRVGFEINERRLAEYRLAGDFLNMSGVDVACVQHEFGIFGGPSGIHLVDMLRRLRMPVVATLHTVLKDPSEEQRHVISQMRELCDRFVVMAERARGFLTDIYDVPDSKVVVIPHGIPDAPFVDPNYYKDQFGVEARKVILTFGLLGPSKGIEQMIEALPEIVKHHGDVTYIVLGATHPGVVAHQGEEYRIGLQRRARELGVADHITWVNKFVELPELVEYLGAADVYVTPYLNEAQITSGTLSYAVGLGKATVSTPYWHAQELLAEDRGVLVPFRDADALANGIVQLFDDEPRRHAIRKKAYQYTRSSIWPNVARQYLNLFQQVREERNRNPRPVSKRGSYDLTRDSQDLAELQLDHLVALTDDTGIFQRARYNLPDRRHGYTTDDNARALAVVLMAQDHLEYVAGPSIERMIGRYLSFLEHAFDDHTRRFRHKLRYDREWELGDLEECEESHGRAIAALGEAVARCHSPGHMHCAADLFQRAILDCENHQHPRSWAYSLIGIHAYLRRFSGDSTVRRVRERLAHQLYDRFQQHAVDGWMWLGDEVTYESSRLPHALLLSGRWMFNNEMIQLALKVLNWLYDVQSTEDGRFTPVGSEGWFRRGEKKARFNQQPIEVSAMIDACLEAYRVTAGQGWLDRAYRCLNWFHGDNDLNQPMYDATTGGCAEALLPQGVSENQNAEATLAWLQSLLALYDHHRDEEGGVDGGTLLERGEASSPVAAD